MLIFFYLSLLIIILPSLFLVSVKVFQNNGQRKAINDLMIKNNVINLKVKQRVMFFSFMVDSSFKNNWNDNLIFFLKWLLFEWCKKAPWPVILRSVRQWSGANIPVLWALCLGHFWLENIIANLFIGLPFCILKVPIKPPCSTLPGVCLPFWRTSFHWPILWFRRIYIPVASSVPASVTAAMYIAYILLVAPLRSSSSNKRHVL